MPALAQTHRVFAFDLKGYGASDKPRGGYDLATLVEEMCTAVRALGFERVDWVGHDWGGSLVWAIALRHPEVVERIAIINAPLHRISPLRSWYILLFCVPGLMEALLARANSRFIHGMGRFAFDSRSLTAEALRAYTHAFALPGVHAAALAWYRSLWRSAPQLRRWLRRKVRRPCLVIWGIHDPVLPVGVLNGIEKHFEAPLEIVPLPRCGHWVMEEQPAFTTRTLCSFFERA
ncbi:MAG: alpha/beta hydrolase [Chloroflexota bacterium]|nr:alpha/beta hydrolase [Chloroflexota bacterium]